MASASKDLPWAAAASRSLTAEPGKISWCLSHGEPGKDVYVTPPAPGPSSMHTRPGLPWPAASTWLLASCSNVLHLTLAVQPAEQTICHQQASWALHQPARHCRHSVLQNQTPLQKLIKSTMNLSRLPFMVTALAALLLSQALLPSVVGGIEAGDEAGRLQEAPMSRRRFVGEMGLKGDREGGRGESGFYGFHGFAFLRRGFASLRRGFAGHHKHGGHHRNWIHHRSPHSGRRRHGIVKDMHLEGAPSAFSVMDFGAAGDGETDDTQAFLSAWDMACQCQGDALLSVPAGGKFLVGPNLNLEGWNCSSSITLQVNGVIFAPQDPNKWSAAGVDAGTWIKISNVSDFVLTGTGTIDGSGHNWWAQSCKRVPDNPCRTTPRAVFITKSSNVVVSQLTFLNSQTMHLDFHYCNQVVATGLNISAPETSPNTDGIHLQETPNAVVQNSVIRTGDDCISIQTGSDNVLIQNIICGPGHGISIGGLGKDDSYAQVSNVLVQNVTLSDSTNGLRIKSWQGASGSVNNVTYNAVHMLNVANPIIVDQYYCDSDNPCQNQTSAVKISNVLYDNIWGTSASGVAVKLACSESVPCENVVLENIALKMDGGQAASAFCLSAAGASVGQVEPPSCLAG